MGEVSLYGHLRSIIADIAFGLQIKVSMHKTNLAKSFKNEKQSMFTYEIFAF